MISPPSDPRDILDGDFDVSDSLPMDNMETHATPLKQVWVIYEEDILVKVIP